MTPDEFERELAQMNSSEYIEYLRRERFIRNEMICITCSHYMELRIRNDVRECFSWRCCNRNCEKVGTRKSVLCGSFFETFRIDTKLVFKILIRWAIAQPRNSIVANFGVSDATVRSVLHSFMTRVGPQDCSENKLGGAGTIVQFDEKMLNINARAIEGVLRQIVPTHYAS
jgi:hypothetical protein